jgi:heme-degrading monooxygenase HmoA
MRQASMPDGGGISMARLFVRHQVANYDAWRKVYDDFDDTRGSMGVKGAEVYRSVDDANDVTVLHDFGSLEDARAFAGASELKAAMDAAGVVGAPQIWFAEEA